MNDEDPTETACAADYSVRSSFTNSALALFGCLLVRAKLDQREPGLADLQRGLVPTECQVEGRVGLGPLRPGRCQVSGVGARNHGGYQCDVVQAKAEPVLDLRIQ